jgi:hypothetical protein
MNPEGEAAGYSNDSEVGAHEAEHPKPVHVDTVV